MEQCIARMKDEYWTIDMWMIVIVFIVFGSLIFIFGIFIPLQHIGNPCYGLQNCVVTTVHQTQITKTVTIP